MSKHGPKANTAQKGVIARHEKRHDAAEIAAQPEQHGLA